MSDLAPGVASRVVPVAGVTVWVVGINFGILLGSVLGLHVVFASMRDKLSGRLGLEGTLGRGFKDGGTRCGVRSGASWGYMTRKVSETNS